MWQYFYNKTEWGHENNERNMCYVYAFSIHVYICKYKETMINILIDHELNDQEEKVY
jgi:hypothetical protein